MATLYKIDGVLWSERAPIKPYCPVHRLEMDPYTYEADKPLGVRKYNHLRCEECEEDYAIPRDIEEQQKYVRRKLEARSMQEYKIMNIDDESIPIAEAKASTKDGRFFVKAILTESRVGQRLVVYAGEKGRKEKTQIFVEPAIKRLAFDQKDTHPSEVFTSLEATFADGTKSTISKKAKRSKT